MIDAKFDGIFGISFIAFLPFIGVAAGVYLFGKISMAHFNPAVTLGFLITKHITKLQLVYYFTAEILGALLGSLIRSLSLSEQRMRIWILAPDQSMYMSIPTRLPI